MGEDFLAAGSRTALVGKAHFQPLESTDEFSSLESYPILQDLDFWRNFDQKFYGFEHVELARNHADEAHVGQHYAIWMEENNCMNWRDYFRPPTGNNKNQRYTWSIPERYHYNTWIAERTNALIDQYQQNDDNFFLWASFFDPHPPYLVPEPWDKMYNPDKLTVPEIFEGEHDHNPPHFQMTQQSNPDFSAWRESGKGIHGCHSHLHDQNQLAKNIAIYYGMISMMDYYIGKILDCLDNSGLTENTLVVFTSDNGGFSGVADNRPLRAGKGYLYEGGIRVPLMVRWPGRVRAGSTCDTPVISMDYYPTILEALGLSRPAGEAPDGESLLPLLEEKDGFKEKPLYFHFPNFSWHMKNRLGGAVRDGKYKLIEWYDDGSVELYDLEDDIGEKKLSLIHI